MTTKKVIFKYLRKATETDRMPMIDGFKYVERGMMVMGWVPPPKNSPLAACGLYLVIRMVLLFFALYLVVGLALTYVMEFNTFTPGELFTSLQAGVNSPGAFLKGVVAVMNAWRLAELKKLVGKMNERCVLDEEHLQVHNAAGMCNKAYLVILITYSVFVGMTFISSVLVGQPPWRVHNPFVDWRASTSAFWITSITDYIFMATGVYFNQINDSYPLVFGMLMRLNLDLLKKRILRLRTDPQRSEEQSYEDLKACIYDHKLILDACELMRPCISPLIFIQYLLVGILLGLVMTNIMFFADFWAGVSCVFYVLGVSLQTFPFSYTCTQIDADCDDLAMSIFHSNWLDASTRYKSTLRHFLHNVQQNITFTAGSIFPICLNTNISVAKLAFSVVTFIKQLNIVEKLK